MDTTPISAVIDTDPPPDDQDELQAIFRRHFEAQFKPLDLPKKRPRPIDPVVEDTDDDQSEWDGISEADG